MRAIWDASPRLGNVAAKIGAMTEKHIGQFGIRGELGRGAQSGQMTGRFGLGPEVG
jgi:hypothetical protein